MIATRRLLTVSAAAGAFVAAQPSLAHPVDAQVETQIDAGADRAPAMTYEYAAAPQDGGVVYHSQSVVQHEPPPPAPYHANAPMPAPMAHPGHVPGPGYGYRHDGGYQGGFDRDAWIDDCRERIRGVKKSERGAVIGGLLGAIAGGVVGNRVYDSERLAGTLIGAGVGGIAGLAIGAAIGAAGKHRRTDECTWYLDRHTGGYRGGQYAYGYGYPGYGYGYGYGAYGYTLMPVMVAVPQRQIVRETVEEEWIDVPVRTRTITKTKVIRQPAPAPRTKLIKDKRIKYSK